MKNHSVCYVYVHSELCTLIDLCTPKLPEFVVGKNKGVVLTPQCTIEHILGRGQLVIVDVVRSYL